MRRPSPAEAPSLPWRERRAPRVGAALVALVLGLLCTFVTTGAATEHQDMPEMTGMTGMTAAGADESGDSSSSACDGMCASDTATCAVAAAVGVPLLLALLAGACRDTFLGLVPRGGARRRRRDRWHRSGPSYAQLCVLRV